MKALSRPQDAPLVNAAATIQLSDETAWWATLALESFCEAGERSIASGQHGDDEIRQTRAFIDQATNALAEILARRAAITTAADLRAA